ncbi:MAG: hypothetical protein F6K41_38635 [Symploca sp. SIO3E6]|nr:hypothetical protein [Caldora sp. SIO3E6]
MGEKIRDFQIKKRPIVGGAEGAEEAEEAEGVRQVQNWDDLFLGVS